MYEIILGRSQKDKEKLGDKGAIFLGKQYVKMGQTTSLSNEVLMDMVRSHVVYICGKRGSGKSYTMGVIAEGMASLPPEVKNKLSIILLDTMGIYWTMKYANKKEDYLLKEWGIEAKPLDVQIYTPHQFHKEYAEKGIPTDFPFSIKPAELNPADWCLSFEVTTMHPMGVLIERVINRLKEKGDGFDIDNIIKEVQEDTKSEQHVKDATENRFLSAKSWGIFSKEGTALKELSKPGQVTVLDMSCYATKADGWKIKALVVGLIAEKLFLERMVARKAEEYEDIHEAVHYFTSSEKKESFPMVWLVLDEAHELLPREGKTAATDALVTILREGRQPGISLILATQQPAKIHTDVMTQADIVISHRITARLDTEALAMITQTWMREGLDKAMEILPRVKGAAVVFDDVNERIYPMRIRPRFTWHGGEAPLAIGEKKNELF
jgi:uncharacterized protein